MEIKDLLDRPIAFQRVFVTLTGSVTAALMLSQAVFWNKRVSVEKDGWFYKTIDEWQDETGLTRYEQETARKKLKKYLQVERRGIPAQLYFRVDEDAILADLIVEKPQTGLGKKPQPEFGKASNINRNSKNTSKTTQAGAAEAEPRPQIDNFPTELHQPLIWFWELFRVPIPAALKGREYERWKNGLTALAEISGPYGRLAFEKAHAEWKRLKFQVGHPGAIENTMRSVVGELERSARDQPENPPDEASPERSAEETAEIQRRAEEARQRLFELQRKKGGNLP